MDPSVCPRTDLRPAALGPVFDSLPAAPGGTKLQATLRERFEEATRELQATAKTVGRGGVKHQVDEGCSHMEVRQRIWWSGE